MTARRRFGSTYRIQLNGFGFAAAMELVPFLHDLGIETVYLSPVTRARAGSSHGYDVADPATVDPSLGGMAGLEALLAAAAAHDMTALLDIVPNHMAADLDNPYFREVLRLGPGSEYADWFDVAWDEQDGRIMLPVLGDSLDDVIAGDGLRVEPGDDAGSWDLVLGEQRYPIDPTTVDGDDATDRSRLRGLIERQHYRLVDWRRANRELNYRRFFDINELIGIRQEDPAVFAATHELILRLAADRRIAGVRVDHVDGLRDPGGYLEQLRDAVGSESVIEVEKILEADESLPAWPVEGTSGYEFAAAVTSLFIDAAGATALARATANATGDARSFATRALEAKRSIVTTRFPHLVDQVAVRLGPALSDIRRDDLTRAVAELAVQLAVYRTYLTPAVEVAATDRKELGAAVERATAALTGAAADAVPLVAEALVADRSAEVADATARWQQLTPPLMAKGVEDTAIYDPGRLLAAADVGTDPDHPALTVAEFHDRMARRQQDWPRAMSTLSTHDSKRSQDVRCRLAVLSEIPGRWVATVDALDAESPSMGEAGPDAAERRYLYETVVGAWPLVGGVTTEFVTRVRDHMVKAGREAKRRSDWIDPDVEHETAVGEFVDQLLAGNDGRRDRLAELVRQIETAGATSSLAAVAIRGVAPGVPDVYQGDDLWSLRLVDPDNRGGMDAPAHIASLAQLTDPSTPAADNLLANWRDGRIKQHVVRVSLRLRRRLAEFFDTADYVPVTATGTHRDHVVAFARRRGDAEVMCVVPRLVSSLAPAEGFPVGERVWGDTALAIPRSGSAEWFDVLSGATRSAADGAISVGSVLEALPVALLERR